MDEKNLNNDNTVDENEIKAQKKKAEPNYKSMFIFAIVVIVVLLIVVFIEFGINNAARTEMANLQQQLSEYQTTTEVTTAEQN